MIISIINNTQLTKEEIQRVLRAVNRQMTGDFKRYWHRDVQVRLEGWTGEQPDPEMPLDMRGDAVIYLWDQDDVEDALGYHDLTARGVPFGFVFTRLSEALDEPWSVTLSHEVLELAMDPEVNLLAQGPHPDPDEGGRTVYHWYELCDAVQADSYEIDGVAVSNFVLPLYFTESEEHQNHNDFLGTSLDSFGVSRGGYIGFFDPETGEHETYMRRGDRKAEQRREAKLAYLGLHRSDRHRGEDRDVPIADPNLVRCEAIVLELEGAAGLSDAEALARATLVARKHLKEDWFLRRVTGDPSEFDVVYRGKERIEFPEGWRLAHDLAEEKEVVWAEPSLTFPVPGESDTEPADTRGRRGRRASSRGEDHLPGTEVPTWGLDFCRVPDAWRFIDKQEGQPGRGVRIGHPDSGYRPHSEMDPRRVLSEIDYDFLDRDPETQSSRGNHGLSTASVIMSGRGPAGDRILGPALHSEIIPLRVTRPGFLRPAPVLLGSGMRRLRDAIDYAVRMGCGVISMSLGGPPSKAVEKAVARATDRGTIVLAAAGNHVRFVVWPARNDDVIAVGGANIETRPWRGSCRGSAVDITAPAESVWRAYYNKRGEPDVARSNGTSYAVALTAGVAAIWLAHHGRDALAQKYGEDQIHHVFRDLIMATANKNHQLPDGKFGAGLLDAKALLEAPLPDGARPARGPRRGARRGAAKGARAERSDRGLREAIREDGLDDMLGLDPDELAEGLLREVLTAATLGAFPDGEEAGADRRARRSRIRRASLSDQLRRALAPRNRGRTS